MNRFSLIFISALLICVSGCMTAAQKQVMAAAQDQVTQLKADNAVLAEKAKENPSGHPLASANATIGEIHPIVVIIFIIALVATFAGAGMMLDVFSPTLQGIGKFIFPTAAATAGGSLVTLFLLPFGFWISIGGFAVGLGLGVFWCISHFKQIEANIKAGTSDPADPALVAAAKAVKVVAKAA